MGNLASHIERCCRGATERERQSAVASPGMYPVYKAFYLGARRDHTALFVETNNNCGGYIYHVVGSVAEGMQFEHRYSHDPAESASFSRKELLGYINQTGFEGLADTLRALPPPPKQYERFRRINPEKPLIDCQNWTTDAIELLLTNGIITVLGKLTDSV